MIGRRFGEWIILEEIPELKRRNTPYFLCKCSCGVERALNKYHLTSGRTKSCVKCSHLPKRNDVSGMKFGKLKVLGPSERRSKAGIIWRCECECGKILLIHSSALLNGKRNRCRECTYEDISGQRFGHQTVLTRCHQTRKWHVRCDCGLTSLKSPALIKTTNSCGKCENINRIGKRFGKLLVLGITHYGKRSQAVFRVRCDCGNEKETAADRITSGGTRSCGCLPDEILLNSARKLIGLKFGYLTVKKILGYTPGTKRIVFQCKCKCGKVKELERRRLCDIKSCGCLRAENHPFATLKNSEVDSIKQLISSKLYSQKEIAKIYNVGETTISRIKWNKSYQL